jgi:DNA-binding response OmpR family regulator
MAPDTLRVLVVDDDAAIRTLLALLCRREGWSVELAPDGAAGLAAATTFVPDVIVLDLMMPGISGFDVLAELARRDAAMLRQVIVLTAVSTAVLTALAPDENVFKLMRKPFDLQELIATIRACAEAHRAGASEQHRRARAPLQAMQ